MVSLKPTNTLGVAVPTHQRWPLGDEGKQAKLFGGGSGPPPYLHRNDETPTKENKREMLMRRACARTPSPPCGLASWPLLGACSMYPGEQILTIAALASVPYGVVLARIRVLTWLISPVRPETPKCPSRGKFRQEAKHDRDNPQKFPTGIL